MTSIALVLLLSGHVATTLDPSADRRRFVGALTLASAIGFVLGHAVAPSALAGVCGFLGLAAGLAIALCALTIHQLPGIAAGGAPVCRLELPGHRPLRTDW